MGKAKKTKTRTDLVIGGNHSNTKSTVSNDLDADLASLDETKRLKACTMLSDLFIFNTSNKMSLSTLTNSQILSKLSMRLVDSSVNVRIQAAQALQSLSDCNDAEVIVRVVNVGLFRSAITLSMEFASLSVNNGEFAEKLFFSIANMIPMCPSAAQEVVRMGSEYTSFLLSLMNSTTSWNVVSAVANLLSVIVEIQPSQAGSVTSFVDIDALTSRLWLFMSELQSYDAARLTTLQLSSPSVILIQCSEILCNVFKNSVYATTLTEKCHIHEIIAYATQLMSTTHLEANRYVVIKMVSNFVLNLLQAFFTDGDSNTDSETYGDIQERRASKTQLILSSDPKLLLIASQLEGCNFLTHCYSALNQVIEAIKSDVAQCAVNKLDEDTNQQVNTVEITRSVQDGFECLEQLLSVTQQYVILKAISGAFLVDMMPFLGVMQYLLDIVNCFTVSMDSNKVTSVAWTFAEHVNENALRDTVLTTCTRTLDFISSLCKVSYNSIDGVVIPSADPIGACYLHVNEETFKALALLLMRCSGYSYMELSLSAILLMGAIGQRGDQIVTLSAGTKQVTLKLIVPLSLNTLLTNCLLRRCQEPNAYSSDSTSDGQDNLARSSVVVMDGCFNSLIDLHCSDDVAYLENFVKLKCVEKLRLLGVEFQTRLRGEAKKSLDAEDREKFTETMENLTNFIEYKQDFISKM